MTRQPVQNEAPEAVPTVDNGGWKVFPDGTMETRWTIKPGVTWHDDAPFTTQDLLFSAAVAQDRDITPGVNPAYAAIDRIEAVDARTVSVHWSKLFIQADRLFITSSTTSPLPSHILEQSYRENNQGLLNHPYLGAEFIGTGPFKVKAFQASSSVTLTAFDRYVMGRPKIDEVEVRFIGDLNTMVANSMAGAVDLTLGRALSADQANQVKQTWQGGKVDITPRYWVELHAQYIDPSPAVVSDVRFHRAMMYAMNRQETVSVISMPTCRM